MENDVQGRVAGATDGAQQASNVSLRRRLGVVVVAMFAFGFLLVPFYDKICEATGIRNIARADTLVSTQVDTGRSIRIELDANIRNLPWQFHPVEALVSVHPGELKQVVYEVVNTTDRPMTGQAVPSYAPRHAAQYFKKLDCFCFTSQTLAPGERRAMQVVFAIDPKLPDDLPVITLSYTFFEVEGTQKVSLHSASGESK